VKRIDYLYLTGTLRCTSAEVLVTRVSDHRPVIIDVIIPDAK
jgi:endonuclease/exonuclease/phosphatase (EEP) superfamily protein YafD